MFYSTLRPAPDNVDEASCMKLNLRMEKCERQLLKGLMPRISQVPAFQFLGFILF
jgi:hypothetical protein